MRKVSSGDDMAAMGMLRTRGHVGFPKHGGGAKIIQNWSFVGGKTMVLGYHNFQSLMVPQLPQLSESV